MNGLALCAGIGGMELGLLIALGGRYRGVGYVEREAFSAAQLVDRMAQATLDPAPVWDDLTTFDGAAWRGCVDIVSAGFPCQPWSSAGAKRKTSDDRWIWPDIARILREVEPRWVFLENVPELVAGGLAPVLADLAAAGFDAEWDIFSATETAAPQIRERLFILAYADRNGQHVERWERAGRGHADGRGRASLASGAGQRRQARVVSGSARTAGRALAGRRGRRLADRNDRLGERSDGTIRPGRDATGSGGAGLASSGGIGRQPGKPDLPAWTGQSHPAGGDGELARANGHRRPTGDHRDPAAGGQGAADPQHGGRPLYPPGPDMEAQWRAALEQWPDAEPSVRRVADGVPDRVDRIRAYGNGVVPLAAALAFLCLRTRLIRNVA